MCFVFLITSEYFLPHTANNQKKKKMDDEKEEICWEPNERPTQATKKKKGEDFSTVKK
jgi:hypothetical protein